MDLLDSNFLFASLFWGSVGVGYWIYGKRRQSYASMIGGVVMIAISYFAPTALVMSLVSFALMVAIYMLVKRDY